MLKELSGGYLRLKKVNKSVDNEFIDILINRELNELDISEYLRNSEMLGVV